MASIEFKLLGLVSLLAACAMLGSCDVIRTYKERDIDSVRFSAKRLEDSVKLMAVTLAAEQLVSGRDKFSDVTTFRQFFLTKAEIIFADFDALEYFGEIGLAVDRVNWISPPGGSVGGWIKFSDFAVERYIVIDADFVVKELDETAFRELTKGWEIFNHVRHRSQP